MDIKNIPDHFESYINIIDIRILWYLAGLYTGLYSSITFDNKIDIPDDLKSILDKSSNLSSTTYISKYPQNKYSDIITPPDIIYPFSHQTFDEKDIQSYIQLHPKDTIIFFLNKKILLSENFQNINILTKKLLLIKNKMIDFSFFNLDLYIIDEKNYININEYAPIQERSILKFQSHDISLPEFFPNCNKDILNAITKNITIFSDLFHIPFDIISDYRYIPSIDSIKSLMDYFSFANKFNDMKINEKTKEKIKDTIFKRAIYTKYIILSVTKFLNISTEDIT